MKKLAEMIPAKWRKRIYTVLYVASGVELALDAVDWGLVDDVTQGKVLTLLGLLGFGMAAANTNKKETPNV